MRVFFGYYWKLVWRAFSGAWDKSQWVLSLATPAALSIAIYFKEARTMKDALDLWYIPFVFYGVVFAIRLVLSPYWIYKESLADKTLAGEKAKANDLEIARLKLDEDRFDFERRVATKKALSDLGIPYGASNVLKRNRYTKRDDEPSDP